MQNKFFVEKFPPKTRPEATIPGGNGFYSTIMLALVGGIRSDVHPYEDMALSISASSLLYATYPLLLDPSGQSNMDCATSPVSVDGGAVVRTIDRNWSILHEFGYKQPPSEFNDPDYGYRFSPIANPNVIDTRRLKQEMAFMLENTGRILPPETLPEPVLCEFNRQVEDYFRRFLES